MELMKYYAEFLERTICCKVKTTNLSKKRATAIFRKNNLL